MKEFYDTLEASVQKEGFRQPCCGYAFQDGLFIKTGMSRAYIAKKLGISFPMIVSDHVGAYSECPMVTNLRDYFYPMPENLVFDHVGFHYTRLPDRQEMPHAPKESPCFNAEISH